MSEIIVEKVVSRDEVADLISYVKNKVESGEQEEFDFDGKDLLKYLKKGSYPYEKIEKAMKRYKGKRIVLHISCINTVNYDDDYKPGDRLVADIKFKYRLDIGEEMAEELNDWIGRLSGKPSFLHSYRSNVRKIILDRRGIVFGLIVTPNDFDALAHELIHFIDYISDMKFADNAKRKSEFVQKLLEKDDNAKPNFKLSGITDAIRLDLKQVDLSYYFSEAEYETWLNDILNVFVKSYEKYFKDKMKPFEYAKKLVEFITPDAVFPNIEKDDAQMYFLKLIGSNSMCKTAGNIKDIQDLTTFALWMLTGYKATNIKNHIFGIFQKKYGHKDNLIERYADEVKRKGTNLK